MLSRALLRSTSAPRWPSTTSRSTPARRLKPGSSFGPNVIGGTSKSALGNLSFANLFKTSAFSLPSFPATAPTSTILPQAQNGFQPTLPKGGKGPLDGGTLVSNPAQSLLGTSIFGSK